VSKGTGHRGDRRKHLLLGEEGPTTPRSQRGRTKGRSSMRERPTENGQSGNEFKRKPSEQKKRKKWGGQRGAGTAQPDHAITTGRPRLQVTPENQVPLNKVDRKKRERQAATGGGSFGGGVKQVLEQKECRRDTR